MVGAVALRQQRGGLVEPTQGVTEAPERVEQPRRGIGVGVGGDAGGIEDRHAGGHLIAAHPAGEQGFAAAFGQLPQALGSGGGIGHRLGREDHQQAIAAGISEGDLDGAPIALRIGVAKDVDGIGVAPLGRQHGIEGGQALAREFRQLAAVEHQGVGGEHAWAAGVSDDRQPRTGGSPRLFGQHIGQIEQVGEAIHPQHAATPQRRLQHRITAGQGTGVGGRRPRRLGSAAALDQHDRLGERHFPRRREEGAGIADRLHINDDAAGGGIVAQVGDQIPQPTSSIEPIDTKVLKPTPC